MRKKKKRRKKEKDIKRDIYIKWIKEKREKEKNNIKRYSRERLNGVMKEISVRGYY